MAPDADRTRVIEPPRGVFRLDVRELWARRELWWIFAARDVRVRYKQAVLGAAWAVLQPLLAAMILAVVFGRFLGLYRENQVSGFLFVYCGMWMWSFFSAVATGGAQSLLTNRNILTKAYFPRLLLPLSVVGYAGLDWLIGGVTFLALAAAWGAWPAWTAPFALVFVIPLLAAAGGVGVGLSALTLKYRDFLHVHPLLFQVWFFATPVAYPLSGVPEAWRKWLVLNPAAGLVDAARALWFGSAVDWRSAGVSAAAAAAAAAAGVWYFQRVEREFADVA